jgi:hypothetical protein
MVKETMEDLERWLKRRRKTLRDSGEMVKETTEDFKRFRRDG